MRNKFCALVLILFFSVGITCVFAQEARGLNTAAEQNLISGSSEKISLDFKNMDIIDALKMIASRAGLNIVVGKNVSGRVTLFLKDVAAWDAFEIIILANDLAYETKGNIINIMTQRDYELIYGGRFSDKKEVKIIQLKYAKAADTSRALNQIKTNLGRVVVDEGSNTVALIDSPDKVAEMLEFIKKTDLPLTTKVYNLNYALAEKMGPKIQEITTKNIGVVRIDERTNKLVVADYPEKIAEIDEVIHAFDEKTPQVLIDAQIIELRPSNKLEVGVNIDYWIKKYVQVQSTLPVNVNNTIFMGTPAGATVDSVGEYKAIIDALRTIGDTKILSSPRIVALNNQEAKIHVGTKDAYITSSTSQSGTGTAITSQSVNLVDTGIQLSVTPTINRDNFITMKIRPELSSSTRTEITSQNEITEIPIVTTSEAETTVTLKDGVTLIIGGLRKDEKIKTSRKIPILGDIPFLGNLFGSVSDEVKKTEIVILLTPHIISGESSFTDFSQIKPKDGAVAKLTNGKIVLEKTGDSSTLDFAAKEKIVEHKAAFSDYYRTITQRIAAVAAANRNLLAESKRGGVKLSFTVARNGLLLQQPAVISSDDPGLIPVAIKSINEASPFPPLPESLDEDRLTFKVDLSF
jgi:type II secretory pathway component GspD/PulD (secretin)